MGYELVGGRLLAYEGKPAAFFLYEDAAGKRLSLIVRKDAWENRETVFRHAREGNVRVFYWIDGPFGYALAGEIDQDELSRLAHEVYQQISS
jgi:anti-sigma factor RsiW